MRRYAVDKFEVCDWDTLKPTGAVFFVPTRKSLQNFEYYLNKKELSFYYSLSVAEQLSVRISVDPFSALLKKMGKL